jgi:dTDP-4-dehydrorhamnose 3,5-epimerase
MKIRPTTLPGVSLIDTFPNVDGRGSFSRLFCERELASVIAGRRMVQINHSRTVTVGTVRGLHFQRPPFAEMKLVRCLKGRVWDVAVDLRASSPTFLQWHAEELTPGTGRMMAIPEGCAHGFQVLEPESELLYLHTQFYTPASQGGVHAADPRVGIAWPLAVRDLSERDAALPHLDADFPGLVI